ncbi:Solute carrier family 25 member 48 [Acipenser ruthenus]|uniref:Solute carrier family 25 member 48 n=1 Tax=Acipenser ruthenus TaxID=7906 RepID=A0A444V726_ACIRT|nr:Solute carrier family 25 member 48 [Acipenser ruthenus]
MGTQTRLQAGKGYKNTFHCILTVYRKENVSGFFKGLSFPLASITLYNSVVFGVYSNTQRLIRESRSGTERRGPDLVELVLSSIAAGFISVGIGAPVDLVKIRLQMQTRPVPTENLTLAGSVPLRSVELREQQPGSRGPVHCISTILQSEGIPGLYRGAGAMVLRDIPGYTLYFVPYTLLCDWLSPGEGAALKPFYICLAGGVAENLTLAGSVPLRSVELREQQPGSRGPVHCISTILQSEGIPGLYRGAGAMVLRDIPGYTLYFVPYTLLCDWLSPGEGAALKPFYICLAGGVAGSISWVTATPADVVKSRLQADSVYQRKYKGIVHCILQSYKTDGLQEMYWPGVGHTSCPSYTGELAATTLSIDVTEKRG